MNKQRRKAINEIITKIENLMDVLEAIRGEEEEYLENIPENLQGSERYEIAEEAIENLEEALTCLEDSLDYMEAAIG